MSFARVRALVVVGALVVLALVFIVIALVRDTQAGDTVAAACKDGEIAADITLHEPKDVKIRVFNATGTAGLAETVATDFANRKFQVVKKGNAPRKDGEGVATLRYGPKAVGAAHLLRAYFLDEAKGVYDPKRTDDVVDVVIGEDFQQLATTTEVNQSLAGLGTPELPAGTCLDNKR
ncbi:MAG TPA: LytR C-terminal domain-containing protein [Micromonospora sp.]